MAPLIRMLFHFRLISLCPRLIQRYDTMQECIPFLFVTSRLVSLPFLDFSQTVRDPTRCDFVHVQAFFENVQDRRMGQSGLRGQLLNCTPSICLQQCGHLTNLGFCCAGSSGPWLMSHSAVQHGRLEPTLQLSYTVMLPYRKPLPVLGNTLLLFCP